MSQKYPGGFITKSPVAPSQGIAPGIWTLEQALQFKKQGVWPPLVPPAPTIGTATATSSTTATVAYTAPTGNGGSPITLYTATSSPGSITGTLSQSGSGTITVSGLTGGTSYTFTVTATNATGTSVPSAASNSITTVPVIGQAFGGGFFCGQISTAGNGIADYNLVLGPKSSTQATGPANRSYKDTNSDDPGAASVSDGAANSDSINNFAHQAVYFCRNLNVGGFTDWYLPAKNEFEICYYNLKPSNQSNDTTSGVNTNAVPSRGSFYTAGDPAVTPIADFTNDSGTNNLNISPYWTSTQANIATAWRQSPANGLQGNYNKTNGNYVRAFRRVAV